MTNSIRKALAGSALILLLVAPAAELQAAWSTSEFENTLVRDADPGAVDLDACTDGEGGIFVVWREESTQGRVDLLAQRLDAAGELVFSSPVLLRATVLEVTEVAVAADGQGGAFVAFVDTDASEGRVYAQRLFADGSVAWADGGVAAYTDAPGFFPEQLVATATGDGGFALAWCVPRGEVTTGIDVFAQHFSAGGTRLWSDNGLVLCQAIGDQVNPTIVDDGVDGVIVAWEDTRSGLGENQTIHGQSIIYEGGIEWETEGQELLDGAGIQENPALARDGVGGAFLACEDDDAVTVTRFLGNGLHLFTRPVTGSGNGSQVDPVIAHDGDGSVVVAWGDSRTSDGNPTQALYAQRLDRTGNYHWDAAGLEVSPADNTQLFPTITFDDDGAALFVWIFDRTYAGFRYDLFAQRIDVDGSRRWQDGGVPVCLAYGNQGRLVCTPDDRGGVLATWIDPRAVYSNAVYAQRVDRWGYLGDAGPVLTGVTDLPQDQGGFVRLDWTASHLDDGSGTVDSYSVWRRLAADEAAAFADPTRRRTAVERVTERSGLAPELVQIQLVSGWSWVDEVPAFDQGDYGFDAPTYGDSTDTEVIVTEYQVLAHTPGGTPFWESSPLGGYSVDNLAPGAPLALFAQLDGQDGVLTWTASGEDDEDLGAYRVYRSDLPGFTPDASNLLATTADTTFVDPDLPPGTWYYLATARDVHGNEGDPSNEAELATATSVSDGLPAALAVSGAVPNPFNPRTEIRFAIPEAARVRVVIHDARGRRVAVAHAGPLEAGRHAVTWNGRGDDGRALPSGLYLARVIAGDEVATAKLMLSR